MTTESLQKEINDLKQQIQNIANQNANAGNIDQNQAYLFNPNIPLPEPIDIKSDIADNMKYFKLSWKNYLEAINLNIRPVKQQIATLLSAIGKDCLRRYENFILTQEDQVSYDAILSAIERNLLPTINKRYERAIFNTTQQADDENFDQYLNRLQSLIKNCQYGEMQNELLLDRIVVSIKNINLRSKLWEDQNITLDQVIQKCIGAQSYLKFN